MSPSTRDRIVEVLLMAACSAVFAYALLLWITE